MLTFAQLQEILKENQIKGYSDNTNKQVKAKKDIDPKYNFLRLGHSNPKKVEIHDLETEKVDLYPPIYKAAFALEQNLEVIYFIYLFYFI